MHWYERYPDRLELERQVVHEHHLHTKWVKKDGLMRIRTQLRGRYDIYCVELVYPRRFPHDKVRGFVRSPKLKPSPHRWADDEPCLEHGDWSPATSGAVWLNWVIQWLQAYEKYLDTGHWPDPHEL